MAGLAEPVRTALIGAGNRATEQYQPLFKSMQPWMTVVAVCDPVKEHADSLAQQLGVPAFYSIHDLVRAKPMEAALIVTPIPSHHSISCYLSQHGIHNQVETTITSLLSQAQEMVATAKKNNVILRVAENFFRFPIDRIAQKVDETGFIGKVGRVTCMYDHTGYHNNSRWVRFFRGYPESVQAIRHSMPVAPYYEAPHRYHTTEPFRCHFYTFPGDRLVVDLAGNIKSRLGRYPRPGYTEFAGERGAIVQESSAHGAARAEVRFCSEEALKTGGWADQIFPVVHVNKEGCWISTYVDLPGGRVEYVNPHRPIERAHHQQDYYGPTIMGHMVDFARAIRKDGPSEYTDQDAVMAMMMEVGTRESELQDGARIKLPLVGRLESEERVREAQKAEYGVDPLDIEGMLAISYPRP